MEPFGGTMGFLKGALGARRYRVVGEVPSGARVAWSDALTRHGFQEPASAVCREETIGWVHADNLLHADFTSLEAWLREPYGHFSLRIDKKVVPPALLRAHVELAAEGWCQENNRSPCPRSVRGDLGDQVEDKLLRQSLARPRTFDVLWHLGEGWLLFGSFSERINGIFTREFFQTFGLELYPDNPLEWLEDPALVRGLESSGATVVSHPPVDEERPHVR
jgi:hypothetical protein